MFISLFNYFQLSCLCLNLWNFANCNEVSWNLAKIIETVIVDEKAFFGASRTYFRVFQYLPHFTYFSIFAFESKSVDVLHESLYRWSVTKKITLNLSRYRWKSLIGDTTCFNFFLLVTCTWNCGNSDEILLNLAEMTKWRIVCEKTLFGVLEMHYSDVSACPWFYPFCLPMALSMCYLFGFKTFAFCIEISSNFARITVPLVS